MYGFTAPETSLFQPLLLDPATSEPLSEPHFVRVMLEVEAALAEAQADVGLVPLESAQAIRASVDQLNLPPSALADGVAKDGVPVPALVKALKQAVGGAHAEWVHYGATSQDIADTALVLIIQTLLQHFRSQLQGIITGLAAQTQAHRQTLVAGRTRSQQAAPINLALKMARWTAPLIQQLERLNAVAEATGGVQLAGAVGTLSVLGEQADPVAHALAKRLGLTWRGGWHTQRDNVLILTGWCATTTAMLGKMAYDWMLMAQSEVGELRFRDGGGSSTMPQKSNPVKAEVIQALARQSAALAGQLYQTGVMAHERDGVAWTNEWLALPCLLSHTGAALAATAHALPNLEWRVEAMQRNLWQSRGLLFAETLTFALAADRPRDEAKQIVMNAVAEVNSDPGETLDLLTVVNRHTGQTFRAEDLARHLLHAGLTDREIDRVLAAAQAIAG